ncbi:glycoside hydrolase family 2 TIM barrel-domain containing protein [Reichenbachiella versicolor]|uniref:glycoside hydrolase family 2 TIM barrel-domain containing protein n=1 Tax=Reichenbachiella versicolor TaxID=1821036 RepID=UPI000D6DEBE3|nr:glycoside hydrolase family 2 TIM barrel-domain containing protein [Reichenbachiella versicolor]
MESPRVSMGVKVSINGFLNTVLLLTDTPHLSSQCTFDLFRNITLIMINRLKRVLVIVAVLVVTPYLLYAGKKVNFNKGWKFIKETIAHSSSDVTSASFNDESWESVSLPHTANVESLNAADAWQGICWYRKSFKIAPDQLGKSIYLELEAAMNFSQIWLNGKLVKEHQGGYLPVVVDMSKDLREENILVVRLDNNDNEITGPKPLKILDFNTFGGLYRNAWLYFNNPVHVSNPILANKVAGGGVFVTYPKVSEKRAIVKVQTNVVNKGIKPVHTSVTQQLLKDGIVVAEHKVEAIEIPKNQDRDFTQELSVVNPALWSMSTPNLYQLITTLRGREGEVLDIQNTQIGIRSIAFRDNKFYLNGEQVYMRGVNRHQEYPYIGYALSDNAQIRDAVKIKEAGFECVRLSHYPHSPSFMRACDSLGLMVFDAILGWQYYQETEAFRNQIFQTSRDLIRRDRNHACVLAWELSLNETKMPLEFREKLNIIAHEEYPNNQCFSAGWMEEGYDIFLQARQHRIMHHQPEKHTKPYFVSEYGDWEYYSSNAGLNQHSYDKKLRYELSSRQARKYGESRLLQQATNIQEAYNDNLGNTPAFGDGYWVMYDYTRGYYDQLEESGVMDIFRLPKWSYYFYKSQKSALAGQKAMVKIASYWNESSPLNIRVFSNCDEVALYLNDKLIARNAPSQDSISSHLQHAPFIFNIDKFTKGEIKAVGYINNHPVAIDHVNTPEEVDHFEIIIDESGVKPAAGQNDVIFAYIRAVDQYGVLVPNYNHQLSVSSSSNIKIINADDLRAEAGIATAVLVVGEKEGTVKLKAYNEGIKGQLVFSIR